MFHFTGRGGYISREATVWEQRLLGLLTPQLFQQPLVKLFSPAQTRTLPWESLSKALTSCYVASCYRRYQYQYGCHVQRHSLKSHWGYYLRVPSITLKMGCREAAAFIQKRPLIKHIRYLRLKLSRYTVCVHACILKIFRNHDCTLRPLPLQDGTTATSLLVLDNTIYSANVGDSRAVLCRRSEGDKLAFVGLSKDHGPSNVCCSIHHAHLRTI